MGAIVGIFILLIYGGILFLTIGGYWKTFSKAGQPGWACLIPIYNVLVMADIARVSRNQVWKALGVIFVGMIFYIIAITQGINSGNPGSGLMVFAMVIYMASIIVSLIFLWPVYKGIALNFGQSEGFAWGLMLLNVIFFAILGFGSAKYIDDGGMKNDDVLDSGF